MVDSNSKAQPVHSDVPQHGKTLLPGPDVVTHRRAIHLRVVHSIMFAHLNEAIMCIGIEAIHPSHLKKILHVKIMETDQPLKT